MDPVSHVSFGRILAAPLGRGAPNGVVAACVVGSLMPDVDLIAAIQGWDVYLRLHQAGTHSIAGAVICGGVTAGVTRAFRSTSGARLRLAGMLGCLGHVALDLISGADIRPLWPIWNGDVRLPLFAMADPWLLAVLVVCAGVVMSRKTTGSGLAPLAAVLVLLVVKGALYERAIHLGPGPAADAIVRFEAQWASWTRWVRYEATADLLRASEIDVAAGAVTPLVQVERGLRDPRVVQSETLETVRNLRATHDTTFARVERRAPDRVLVLWTDLRYCDLEASARLTPLDAGCALWFGGEYDERAAVRAVLVQVGPIAHRRAP